MRGRWALAAAALAAMTGCGMREQEPVRLAVGTWKTQQTLQPFLYRRFLPPHLRCEVKAFTNPGDMKTALLAGSLDLCGTTLVHAIVSAARGEPVVIVASLCDKCSALVVGAGSGIDSVAGLRGKRIGYVPSTMHHVLLLAVLRGAGLSSGDVTLVRVDFFDMLNALAGGQIDAFLSGEPFPTRAVESGVGRVLAYPYFDDAVGAINGALIVRRDTADARPQQVAALVLAHARATEHLREHPQEWTRMATAFGNDEKTVRAAAANIELAWDMDSAFAKRVQRLGAEMLALGMIDRLPDWDRLIDTRFVSAVNERREPGR